MRRHDLDYYEREELAELSRRFECALNLLEWRPVRINDCWLGNEVHLHEGHGHAHLIPRYDQAPMFDGRTFPDQNPGANYTPHDRLTLADPELFRIRDAMKEAWERA